MTELEKLLALRTRLAAMVPQQLLDDQARDLFFECWDLFDGNDAESMAPRKLHRVEQLRWEPPCIVFEIERHGGTVMGSTRADVQQWRYNVDTLQADAGKVGFRQVRQREPIWKAEVHAERVATAVASGKKGPALEWSADRKRVRILLGKIVPPGFSQTVAGRRRRFSEALVPALERRGWVPATGARIYTFERAVHGKTRKSRA